MTKKRLQQSETELATALAASFGTMPAQIELFVQAFTHSSYAYEHKVTSNQRLEFLGDSVLGLIVCEYLFQQYSQEPEGYLAKLKSTIVGSKMLAFYAKKLELEKFIRLGQGELRCQGSSKKNLLEDLFEAFLGAYYLNFGLAATKALVLPLLESTLEKVIEEVKLQNAKNRLQEWGQARGLMPAYRTIKIEGPPHKRLFTVEALLDERVIGTAAAATIKEAENKAAALGMSTLQNNN